MARRHEDRARAWARHLRAAERASGVVIALGRSIFSFSPEEWTARDWLGDELRVPRSAVRWNEEDRVRLHASLTSIARARDLQEYIDSGLPPLRRWRRTDVDALVRVATDFVDRVGLASQLARLDDADEQVRLVIGEERKRRGNDEISAGLPKYLRSPQIERDAAVAQRLLAHPDPGVARRWIESARARWWAAARDLATLDDAAALAAVSGSAEQRIDALRHAVRSLGMSGRVEIDDQLAGSHGGAQLALGRLHDLHVRPPSPFDRAEVLDLLLSTPGATWSVSEGSTSRISSIAHRLHNRLIDPEVFIPRIPALLRLDVPIGGLVETLTGRDLDRVLGVWPVHSVPGGWQLQRLRRYIRMLEDAGPEKRKALQQQWIATLMNSDMHNRAADLLAVVPQLSTDDVEAARALIGVLGARTPGVEQRLRTWETSQLARHHPELDDIANELEIDRSKLVDYLHFRRLAGEDEVLPRRIRRASDGGAEQQMRAIEATLTSGGLSVERRNLLEQQLGRLAARKTTLDVKLVRNQLRSSTQRYRVSSLRRLLLGTVSDMVGEDVSRVPLGLIGDVISMETETARDLELLRRFLDGGFLPGRVQRWPENQAWIERCRGGFDVDRWLTGFVATATVGGTPVTYRTVQDPVLAIHHGTWFNTCLSLPGGMYASVALTNVIEANRHVVYGFDSDENVVARKLLAVGPPSYLLGYRTYAVHSRDEHDLAIGVAAESFARECGLRLSTTRRPESLTGGTWYDDGAQPWVGRSSGPHTSGRPPNSEVRERSGWEVSEAWTREELSDADISAALAHSGNESLIEGLWLDGRVSDPGPVVQRDYMFGEHGRLLPSIGLFDPRGLTRALRSAPRRAGYVDSVGAAVDRGLIAAIARRAVQLEPWQLALLEPVDVDRFAQQATSVGHVEARLLRHRATNQRALVRAMTRVDPSPHAHLVVRSSRQLRQLLDVRDTSVDVAVAIAVELAARQDQNASSAVAQVANATRHPVACAAAASFDVDVEPLEAKVSNLVAPDLLRIAILRFPSSWTRVVVGRGDKGRLGHPDHQPANDEEQAAWTGSQLLAGALESARAGDLNDLSVLAAADGNLLDGPVVHELLVRELVSGDAARLAQLVRLLGAAMAPPFRPRPWSVEGIAIASFATYLASPDGDPIATDSCRTGVLHLAEHQESMSSTLTGVAASLAERLPADDAFGFLDAAHARLIESDRRRLGVLIAQRVRTDPEVLSRAGSGASPSSLDAVVKHLRPDESLPILRKHLQRLGAEELQILLLEMTGDDILRYHSPLQLEVLVAAANREPLIPAVRTTRDQLAARRMEPNSDSLVRRDWLIAQVDSVLG